MTASQKRVKAAVLAYVDQVSSERVVSVRHVCARGVIARRRGVFVVLVCEHDAEPQLRGKWWYLHRCRPLASDYTTHPDVKRTVGEWVSSAYVNTATSGMVYTIPAVP